MIHVAFQHAPDTLEDVSKIRKNDILNAPLFWKELHYYIPYFDHFQVIQSNCRLAHLYFLSLHAIKSWCVFVSSWMNKAHKQWHLRLRLNPAAMNRIWFLTRRCKLLLRTSKVAKCKVCKPHSIFCIFGWVCIKIAVEYR